MTSKSKQERVFFDLYSCQPFMLIGTYFIDKEKLSDVSADVIYQYILENIQDFFGYTGQHTSYCQ